MTKTLITITEKVLKDGGIRTSLNIKGSLTKNMLELLLNHIISEAVKPKYIRIFESITHFLNRNK